MKKFIIQIVFLSLFLFVHCQDNPNNKKTTSLDSKNDSIENKQKVLLLNGDYSPYIDKFRKQALEKGDTNAYDILSLDNWDSPSDSFIYIAKKMANKFEYSLAYYDVYCCLTDIYHKKENTELDNLDNKTRSLALNYLIKGAKKFNIQCMKTLAFQLNQGKYIPKNEKRAKMLMERANFIIIKKIYSRKIQEIKAKKSFAKEDSILLKKLYKMYCPDS
jgi:hypothetical protein